MSQRAVADISKLVQLIEEAVSQERPDSSQMRSYLHECRQLGVEVLPLDVNRSEAVCVIEDAKNIRLGFSLLVKKGAQFIEDLLAERQQHGLYRSFQDFCERLELDLIPEDVLARGIQAGVFDAIEPSRARLWLGRKKIMQAVRKARTEKATGQISLFALLPAAPKGQNAIIELPAAEEWGDAEMIAQEKEAVGFSFTEFLFQRETEETPEPEVAESDAAENLAPIAVEQAAAVLPVEPVADHTETPLEVPTVESAMIENGAQPIATLPEIAAVEVEEPPLPPIASPATETFFIRLSTLHTTEHTLLRLRAIIETHPGKTPVMLEFHDERRQKTQVSAHSDYAVAVSVELVNAVETLTGPQTTRLQALMARP